MDLQRQRISTPIRLQDLGSKCGSLLWVKSIVVRKMDLLGYVSEARLSFT